MMVRQMGPPLLGSSLVLSRIGIRLMSDAASPPKTGLLENSYGMRA